MSPEIFVSLLTYNLLWKANYSLLLQTTSKCRCSGIGQLTLSALLWLLVRNDFEDRSQTGKSLDIRSDVMHCQFINYMFHKSNCCSIFL